MNSFLMILKYWLRSKKAFFIQFSLLAISTVFSTMIPIYLGRIVGSLDPNLIRKTGFTQLTLNFIILAVLATLTYITSRAGRTSGAEVSSRAIYHLRSDISTAINQQSFSFFDKTETGQLISRTTSDVEETQQIFGMGLNLGIQSILQITGVIVGFLIFSLEFSFILLIMIVISTIISVLIAKKLKPIFLETRYSFGDLTNTIRENIVGADVVRIFNTQEKESKKFSINNDRFFKASVDSVKFNALYAPLMYLTMGIMTITILLIGGRQVIQGIMQLEVLVTLQSYVAALGFPLMMLGQLMLIYIQADAALTRIREVFESTSEIVDLDDAIHVEKFNGDIEFDDASFGYLSSRRILKNVSFKLSAGKKLAILGTTGSGKSTIINLIPRFYDVNQGIIKIDGIDIRKIRVKDLRKRIGIVSQETFLFNKTIGENLSYGNENASKEQIIWAAKVADLHDFIISLPKGYDTLVGERGARLSGGQKQRLSIARALIIKPDILILDDSTSSVDVETEFNIQNALEEVMKDTTSIIITQRISTIRNADLILIMDRGRVVGFGTHDKLIESNVLYKQIFQTLFQKQKSVSSNWTLY
jgi:ATP-binding cassette subfamily B multidrug efflux pump